MVSKVLYICSTWFSREYPPFDFLPNMFVSARKLAENREADIRVFTAILFGNTEFIKIYTGNYTKNVPILKKFGMLGLKVTS